MDAGDIDTEGGDRLRPDRTDDAVVLRGHGIESAADPVVVEDLGRQPESLFDRPVSGLVLDVDQRGGRGETVGDQRFDHLAVARVRDVAHRAARSTVPAMSRRRAKPATTGNAPGLLSTLGGP